MANSSLSSERGDMQTSILIFIFSVMFDVCRWAGLGLRAASTYPSSFWLVTHLAGCSDVSYQVMTAQMSRRLQQSQAVIAYLLRGGGQEHIKTDCTENTEFRPKSTHACVALMDKSEDTKRSPQSSSKNTLARSFTSSITMVLDCRITFFSQLRIMTKFSTFWSQNKVLL